MKLFKIIRDWLQAPRRLREEFEALKLEFESLRASYALDQRNYTLAELRHENAARDIRRAQKFVQDAVEVHLEGTYSPRLSNTVVVIGRFKGRDYVEIHSLQDVDFEEVVKLVQHYAAVARLGRIDGPRGYSLMLRESLERRGIGQ